MTQFFDNLDLSIFRPPCVTQRNSNAIVLDTMDVSVTKKLMNGTDCFVFKNKVNSLYICQYFWNILVKTCFQFHAVCQKQYQISNDTLHEPVLYALGIVTENIECCTTFNMTGWVYRRQCINCRKLSLPFPFCNSYTFM